VAIRFDATADRLTRTTTLPSITAFTMMCWLYVSVTRGGYATIQAYGSTTFGSAVYQVAFPGGSTTLEVYNGSSAVNGSTVAITTWTHIAMTVAGTGAGQFLCYKNGVLDATHAGNSSVPSQTLWYASNGGEWLNGRLAAVKVWGAVLTANEILMEMKSYLPIRLANLNTWSPLLIATDVTDYSGASAAWTIGGTLATEDGPPIPWSLRSREAHVSAAAAPAVGPIPGSLMLSGVGV
jgi:hypothetical protein